MARSDRSIALGIAALAALAYVLFGLGAATVYDYYGRLAEALLQGRWWLLDSPSWLNELVACGEGRFCVVYPPLPAIASLPFVPFLGTDAGQSLVSQMCGGLSAGVLYLALRVLGAPRSPALAGAVLSAFGTTLFFSSADGRAWFAAHAVAMPLTSLALLVAARRGPAWAIGAVIGLAALARLPVAAAAPALALLLALRTGAGYVATLRGVVLGGVPFAVLYVGYDLVRWGTPFGGYGSLTEGDVFFNHGLFSLWYLPRHLYAIFMEAPLFSDGTLAFLRFRVDGMSLFLTTPAFLWVFAGLRHVRAVPWAGALALAAGLALLPNVLHGTVGFAQFGYRFSIDAQPFLIALAVAGDAFDGGTWRGRPSGLFLVAIAVSILVNVYATITIMRFGYWG